MCGLYGPLTTQRILADRVIVCHYIHLRAVMLPFQELRLDLNADLIEHRRLTTGLHSQSSDLGQPHQGPLLESSNSNYSKLITILR
jgi:hypothetical protein